MTTVTFTPQELNVLQQLLDIAVRPPACKPQRPLLFSARSSQKPPRRWLSQLRRSPSNAPRIDEPY